MKEQNYRNLILFESGSAEKLARRDRRARRRIARCCVDARNFV